MDTQRDDHVLDIDDLERKADKLIRLILSMCEDRIRACAKGDARASSLANAAIAAQNAIYTFLALARIR